VSICLCRLWTPASSAPLSWRFGEYVGVSVALDCSGQHTAKTVSCEASHDGACACHLKLIVSQCNATTFVLDERGLAGIGAYLPVLRFCLARDDAY